MAFDMDSIKKGPDPRPPRICLCGEAKIGKSTFGAGAPNPIFLPIKGEEGIDHLDVSHFPVAGTFEDVMVGLNHLKASKHDFGSVVVDSLSALAPLIETAAVIKERVKSAAVLGGGFGRQFDTILSLWASFTGLLDDLRDQGMVVIVIGHVTTKRFSDPLGASYDMYEIDLPKPVAAQIYRWSDSILFASFKTIVRTEEASFGAEQKKASGLGERRLFTQNRPAHPGGGRGPYGQMDYEIKLSWKAFISAVNKAS